MPNNKKIFLIVNPCSGRAKMGGQLLSVVNILSEGGYEITVYPTKCRGDATKRVKLLKQNEYSIIVVCGGDGTLNEVITGLMEKNLSITLGYIPSGTLNEWSAGLNISRNIKKAAEDIIKGTRVDLDVGRFGNKYFSYTASFGAFTEVSYSAPQDAKNVFGQAAYFFEGIKSLGNIRPIPLKISCEEQELEGDFLFGAISNSMSVGGIVKFSDNVVKLNDGLFEVLLVRNPENILGLQTIFDGILWQDLEREGIEFFHTKKIVITGGEDVSWTLDGEYSPGAERVTIENLPSAIRLIVPNEKQLQISPNLGEQ